MGKASEADAARFHELGEIENRRFAFHVGIGGADHLMHTTTIHTLEKGVNAQLLWSNAIKGGECSHQHMVETFVDSCTLNEENIAGILHDTDDTTISRWVGA